MKWFIKLALDFDSDILLTKDKAWLIWTQRDIEPRFTSPDIPPSATTSHRVQNDESNSQIYQVQKSMKISSWKTITFCRKGGLRGI